MLTPTQATPQQRIKATLESCGLPYKQIDVYGSQIVITAWSDGAARKWASLIAKFATVRGMTHSVDYAKENKGTCLLPSTVEVWLVFGVIE